MTRFLGSGLLKRIEAPERDFSLRPEVGRIAEHIEELLARPSVEARVVGQLPEHDHPRFDREARPLLYTSDAPHQ